MKPQYFIVTVVLIDIFLLESSDYRFCSKCFIECVEFYLMKCKSCSTILQFWISLMLRTSNNSRPILHALCSMIKTISSSSHVRNSIHLLTRQMLRFLHNPSTPSTSLESSNSPKSRSPLPLQDKSRLALSSPLSL